MSYHCYRFSQTHPTTVRHPRTGRVMPVKPMHGFICCPEPQATCWVCGELAEYLCDHPAGEGTCDAAMCPAHAATAGDDRHHCGAHYARETER